MFCRRNVQVQFPQRLICKLDMSPLRFLLLYAHRQAGAYQGCRVVPRAPGKRMRPPQNCRIPRCNGMAPKGNGSTGGCTDKLNVALACTPIPRQVPYAPERPYLKGKNPQRSPAWGFYFGRRRGRASQPTKQKAPVVQAGAKLRRSKPSVSRRANWLAHAASAPRIG
jgi:hypothetical protein